MVRMYARAVVVLALSVMAVGCQKKAASLSLEPKEFLPMERKGKTVQLKAQTKDDRNIFVATVQPTWTSKDPSVASVDAEGIITAVSTGQTEVVGSFEGLSAAVPVTVRIVGSVELTPAGPHKLRMGRSLKLVAVVKDDHGTVMEGERVIFKTIGYAVDVEQDGTVTGQALGETQVVAVAKGQEARVRFDVTD